LRLLSVKTYEGTWNLIEKIEMRKENWCERIFRMKRDRLPKILLNYKARGQRSTGRYLVGWEDIFSGITLEEEEEVFLRRKCRHDFQI
jgi:hypothetical protein